MQNIGKYSAEQNEKTGVPASGFRSPLRDEGIGLGQFGDDAKGVVSLTPPYRFQKPSCEAISKGLTEYVACSKIFKFFELRCGEAWPISFGS